MSRLIDADELIVIGFDASDCEHQLQFVPIEFIDNAPTIEIPQWIPCEERLPDTDDMMLVSCETKKGVKNVNRAYYSDGFWHGSGSMSGVKAWMPLPEPYKGES